ncbi:MAG: restriction endonuclease subunit S, partial [Nitrososphaera sp.]
GYNRRSARLGLLENGLSIVAAVFPDMLFENFTQVSMGLLILRRQNSTSHRKIVFLDLANYVDLPSTEDFLEMAIDEGVSLSSPSDRVVIPLEEISEDYRLDPQYYDPAYLKIKPPDGYSDFVLGEIAEIRGGVGFYESKERFETDPGNGVPYLQVRHILDNGEIAENFLWLKRRNVFDSDTGWAKPGDILITVAGTIGKVAIVPSKFDGGVFYDTSIRRVRVDPQYAEPEAVFSFLRSDLGRLQFRRLTSGTVIPQLTSPALATLRVFLPPSGGTSSNFSISEIENVTTQANIIAAALQSQVIDYLKGVTEKDINWQIRVRQTLRGFLKDFLPTSLEEAILTEFPAPIAIPY